MKRGSAARGVRGQYHTLYIAELQFRYDAPLNADILGTAIEG
jgi:hypothetical protein